jgi:Flp pilus assembly CpaE family ATPase
VGSSGGWYSISALSAPDPRGGPNGGPEPVPDYKAGEEPPTRPFAAIRGPVADPNLPILEQRLHLLEMSTVFWQLGDGPLMGLARRMREMAIPEGRTVQLKREGQDGVIFLASGGCERTITNEAGKILATRRSLPGDQIVLPPPAARGTYTTTLRALSDSTFATLDRDTLEKSLGTEFQPLSAALDTLWDQEVAAFEASGPAPAGQRAGTVVAFCSAKGGSGTTTLAVNTAAALAGGRPDQVVLLDLSAPYGHAALYADLIATGSTVSAGNAPPDAFGAALRGVIIHHRSGLSVLPGVLRPEEADLLSGDLASRTLTELSAIYRLIVVDLGTTLSEASVAVIERARRIVLVVPPEVAALTDARRALGVFTDLLQMHPSRIDLVLNQRVPRPPLDRAAVESILGHEMSATIGFDGSRPEAASLAGGLVLMRDPESLMAKGSVELAKLLAAKIGFGA